MPKWAARTGLRVNRVWVERVQDISESDAMACGVDPYSREATRYRNSCGSPYGAHALAFLEMWDKKHAGTESAFDCNPWVWACEVERIER
jgi:hypothetical protein